MAREPGTSFPSETRQLVRQDRVKPEGRGPHVVWVIAVALILAGALIYTFVR